MSDKNILLFIPQRPPFVMIDRLLHAEGDIVRTSFRVTGENIFAEGGQFLEAGLLENIAQTAAAGAGYIASRQDKPVQTGYIASVKDLEIAVLPEIGDELVTETKTESRIFNVVVVSGTVWCKGSVVATCEMKIFENT